MNKASRFAAALVLTLGLAACGGSASSAATDATSTADSTSIASAADVTSTTADSTSAGTDSSSADTYTNADLGISFTLPEGFSFSDQGNGTEFIALDSSGNSVNLIVGTLAPGEDFFDDAYMDEVEQEFTNSLDQQGIEGASITQGTYTFDNGDSYPSMLGSGTLRGTAIDLMQIYVQKDGKVGVVTITSVTLDPTDILATFVVE